MMLHASNPAAVRLPVTGRIGRGSKPCAPFQTLRANSVSRLARLVSPTSRKQLRVSATATTLQPLAGAVPPPPPATLPPPKVLEFAINVAVAKASYSWQKLLVLSFIAGAQIGLGGLLMTVVSGGTGSLAAAHPGIQKFITGAVGLPTGLALVVLTGSELFTGNVFVMTAAWLEKKVSTADVLKNWTISFFGNFIGAIFVAYLAYIARTTAVAPWLGASVAIASAKVSFPFLVTFVKGVLCNWLVCTAVWMAMASQNATGKFLGIWIPVSLFVTLGFEHSVANMFLIPQGMLNAAPVTVEQFLLGNLLPVTLGNIVGGAVLMGAGYWFAYSPSVNSK